MLILTLATDDLAFGPTFNDKEYSEWLTAAELKKGYQYYAKRYDLVGAVIVPHYEV